MLTPTGTKTYWDKKASSWDAIYLEESPASRRINMVLRRAIFDRFSAALRALPDLTGRSVLDVGCGSGRLSVEAARRGAGRVLGLDFAPNMLEIAQGLAKREGVGERCEFRQGDFMALDLGGEKFDMVVANGFFDYMGDPQAVLSRMVQLSRGVVVASFPGKQPVRSFLRKLRYQLQGCAVYFYSEQDVRRLAEKAGLRDYDLHHLTHSGTGYILVGRVNGAGA
jgi:ubiquinone/menaquinone biosynthesis C-methylase UbiE